MWHTIILFIILHHEIYLVGCGKFKVVDAPFSFNSPLNNRGGTQGSTTGKKVLMTRVDPQKPSGPPYLIEKLNGKCFEHMANNYRYEFCPFQNVTQREQTYRWNAFQGVLGVWRHWLIKNGTFSSMHMTHGEVCVGTLDREVQVKLKCGENNKIISVSEPDTCRYVMIFKTPFACPNDVFDVYPMLTERGKNMWENIERDFMMEMITRKGYDKRMEGLFETEALYFPFGKESIKKDIAAKADSSREEKISGGRPVSDIANGFLSKHQCVQEYEKLYKEVIELRQQLQNIGKENSLPNNVSFTGRKPELNKTVMKNNFGEYKRGELGDKRNVYNSSDTLGRVVRRNDTAVADEKKNNLPQRLNLSESKESLVHLRGDAGTIEEIENPDRLLRDRLHENGVPDHEKIHPTEEMKERAISFNA